MIAEETGPTFQTKAEWVRARLRDMIAGGELRPGERLRLAALAKRFQTSEMPVREALRMLQRDGLVEIQSHRGARVADVTWERVYEAVLIRMHLESLALREAAPHHDEHSLGEIERLLAKMDLMAERNRAGAFSEANRRFHTSLYQPCPLPLLKDEIQALWDTMWRTRSRSLFHLEPNRMTGAQQEHWRIVQALRRKDTEEAITAAEEHKERTLAAWRSVARQMAGDAAAPVAES